ncbi:hypothetical protein ACFL35_10540 [Candidatus Riflebacteria bacterium]
MVFPKKSLKKVSFWTITLFIFSLFQPVLRNLSFLEAAEPGVEGKPPKKSGINEADKKRKFFNDWFEKKPKAKSNKERKFFNDWFDKKQRKNMSDLEIMSWSIGTAATLMTAGAMLAIFAGPVGATVGLAFAAGSVGSILFGNKKIENRIKKRKESEGIEAEQKTSTQVIDMEGLGAEDIPINSE